MTKGIICVSSVYSREEVFPEYRFVARLAIESLGYVPMLAPENPGSNQSDYNNVLDNDNPLVIAIIGSEDSEAIQEEFSRAIRNNLYIIPFLKTSSDGSLSDTTKGIMNKISTDVFRVQCTTFSSVESLYNSIRARITIYDNSKKVVEALEGNSLAYERATDMIANARNKIIVCQKTSSLILGPKKGNTSEKIFYDSLVKLLNEISETPKTFLHIFSYDETVAEMKRNYYDIERSKETLIGFVSKNENEHKIMIKGVKEMKLNPLVLSDNYLFLSVIIGSAPFNLMFPRESLDKSSLDLISDKLSRYTGEYCDQKSLIELYDFSQA